MWVWQLWRFGRDRCTLQRPQLNNCESTIDNRPMWCKEQKRPTISSSSLSSARRRPRQFRLFSVQCLGVILSVHIVYYAYWLLKVGLSVPVSIPQPSTNLNVKQSPLPIAIIAYGTLFNILNCIIIDYFKICNRFAILN